MPLARVHIGENPGALLSRVAVHSLEPGFAFGRLKKR